MNRELSALNEFYFQWHITERCNKHCRHCYQNSHPKNDLPLAYLDIILARMEEALIKWDMKGSLSLTGGEPFVRESELFSLMNHIDQVDSIAFYDVLTNGSLLTDKIITSLKKHKKLRRIQVSLEGSTPDINDAIRGEGGYAETLNAIRRMKRQELTVSVMTTLSRLNYDDIPHLIELLDTEGVDTFAMERLIPEGRGQQLYDMILTPQEIKDIYKNAYKLKNSLTNTHILMYRPLFTLVAPDDPDVGALCSVGNNALTIMPDGTVYPCRRLPISIGNILEDGLFKIWYDTEVLWKIRNPENIQGKCKTCSYLANCRGCRAMAYYCSGDYLAEDPSCWS